jgi:hypothetical protein
MVGKADRSLCTAVAIAQGGSFPSRAGLRLVFTSITIPPVLMTNTKVLLCDGCGQPASSEHVAKRLQRLEWTTRYRPVHIAAVLLGAAAPKDDTDFLYAPAGMFGGEAKYVLNATGISLAGKSSKAVLTAFQRGGFLLTYALECPLEVGLNHPSAVPELLTSRLPALLARIRRSLRPKRIVPISLALTPLLESLTAAALGCVVLLDAGKPFALDGETPDQTAARLGDALGGIAAPAG